MFFQGWCFPSLAHSLSLISLLRLSKAKFVPTTVLYFLCRIPCVTLLDEVSSIANFEIDRKAGEEWWWTVSTRNELVFGNVDGKIACISFAFIAVTCVIGKVANSSRVLQRKGDSIFCLSHAMSFRCITVVSSSHAVLRWRKTSEKVTPDGEIGHD